MENTPAQSTNESNDIILNVTRPAAHFLQEISKWATFLAIVGFIFTGLIVVLAFFAGTLMSTIPPYDTMPSGFGIVLTFMYLLIGVLYFFPTLYLYKFSQKLKSALTLRDSNDLTIAFENLKSIFKFWGIFTIVILCFYGLALLITVGVSLLSMS